MGSIFSVDFLLRAGVTRATGATPLVAAGVKGDVENAVVPNPLVTGRKNFKEHRCSADERCFAAATLSGFSCRIFSRMALFPTSKKQANPHTISEL
ncbi:hypothetical protein [Caballeronia sp. SBC2]|uniref:hypothetical protein n=1 Tax=Caballeronia sp. SBC2 TaxID=2705547 RepID=UPI0013ECCA56|nr:hypothetical protein [Caballeronia sp. SBC2]